MTCFIREQKCGPHCKAYREDQCLILTSMTGTAKSLASIDRSLKGIAKMTVRKGAAPPPRP